MQINNHNTAQAQPTHQYFNPAVKHSDAYYLAVLLALAEGVSSGCTDREIAAMLSNRGILSPVGRPWSSTGVSQALSKLRNYRDRPNRLHQAFLQLCLEGYLKPSDVSVLFRPRKQYTM